MWQHTKAIAINFSRFIDSSINRTEVKEIVQRKGQNYFEECCIEFLGTMKYDYSKLQRFLAEHKPRSGLQTHVNVCSLGVGFQSVILYEIFVSSHSVT